MSARYTRRNPGKCPIGRAFGAFGKIPAPDGSLDGIDRPPNDVEGPGGIEFADHGRLRQMIVGVHDHLETARLLDPLTVHRQHHFSYCESSLNLPIRLFLPRRRLLKIDSCGRVLYPFETLAR